MAKDKTQVSLTLEIPDFERLETIANAYGHRPGGAARIMFLERLALYESGWKLNNEPLQRVLHAICSLKEDQIKGLEDHLKRKQWMT